MKTTFLFPSLFLASVFVVTGARSDEAGDSSPGGFSVATSEPVADFEQWNEGEPGVMFQHPSFSSTTQKHVMTEYATQVTGEFPRGNARAGGKALRVKWDFKSETPQPWLRLTTFNAQAQPNPTIDARARLRFDLHANQPLGVAMYFRETETSAAIGEDGGFAGGIEYVGVKMVSDGVPVCDREVPAGQWTTVEFDLPQANIVSFTGDGILAPGKGVLESLILVSLGGVRECVVYLDNVEVVYASPNIHGTDKIKPAVVETATETKGNAHLIEAGKPVVLAWQSRPQTRYYIMQKDASPGATWVNLGTELSFGDEEGMFTLLESTTRAYYRVVEKDSGQPIHLVQALMDSNPRPGE